MTEEKWLPIKSGYEVSSLGRVRSIPRTIRIIRKRNGIVLTDLMAKYTGRVLSPSKNSGGYECVMMGANGNGRIPVHRLVAEAFIPNPENKPQVNHKNGIRDDNRVENLEWATNSENQRHRAVVLRTGTVGVYCGESHPMSKLNDNDVLDMRTLVAFGANCADLCRAFSISISAGHNAITGKTWKHLNFL